MKNKPLVSIIIPTFNRRCISNAINSVISQTYKNIEIIVVDDNVNKDISKHVHDSIKKIKHDIKYIKNSKNIGGALSRNIGINNSNGEFIAFLDDDDVFLLNKIFKQLEYYYELNNPKIAVITCNTYNYLNDKLINKEKHASCKNSIVKFIYNKTATTSTWLVRKDCLLEVNNFDNIKAHQEGLPLNILEALYKKKCIVATKERGVIDLIHDGNGILVGKNDKIAFQEAIYLLKNDEDIRNAIVNNINNVQKYSNKNVIKIMERIYEKY